MSTTTIPVQTAPSRVQTWRKAWFNRETAAAWIFLLPSLIGFIAFYAVPAARAVSISFTDWDLLTDPQNIGLENYSRLIADEDFWQSLRVTFAYVLFNIPIQTMIALVIAVLMDRFTKSIVVRGIMILPWLMPNVVVGLLWLWLLDPSLGIVNVFIEWLGFSSVPFLTGTNYALPSIAGINIWRHMGYTALLIFAGLQAIPGSVYEAAAIDGASELRTFWSITIPLLRPVLVFVLVTSIIGSFQIFDTVAITTEGGPVNATEVLNWFIYEHAFVRFNMGYATTISVVLFLILIVVSVVQMRIMRADESDL
ncbi:carbohydrate ABC transporter permease [Candidatus Leptofilum sp.]|uniref:carbohydrate ABC transporter permease n=1 Tax=Candidatus Leptofilum sp. TaxID=3241576 RepID=UPI003B5C1885